MSATLRFHDCLEWELANETCQLHWICSRYLCRAVLNVSEKYVNIQKVCGMVSVLLWAWLNRISIIVLQRIFYYVLHISLYKYKLFQKWNRAFH